VELLAARSSSFFGLVDLGTPNRDGVLQPGGMSRCVGI
jgi:hypothetical protein